MLPNSAFLGLLVGLSLNWCISIYLLLVRFGTKQTTETTPFSTPEGVSPGHWSPGGGVRCGGISPCYCPWCSWIKETFLFTALSLLWKTHLEKYIGCCYCKIFAPKMVKMKSTVLARITSERELANRSLLVWICRGTRFRALNPNLTLGVWRASDSRFNFWPILNPN